MRGMIRQHGMRLAQELPAFIRCSGDCFRDAITETDLMESLLITTNGSMGRDRPMHAKDDLHCPATIVRLKLTPGSTCNVSALAKPPVLRVPHVLV